MLADRWPRPSYNGNPLGMGLRRVAPWAPGPLKYNNSQITVQPFIHLYLFRAGSEHATRRSNVQALVVCSQTKFVSQHEIRSILTFILASSSLRSG